MWNQETKENTARAEISKDQNRSDDRRKDEYKHKGNKFSLLLERDYQMHTRLFGKLRSKEMPKMQPALDVRSYRRSIVTAVFSSLTSHQSELICLLKEVCTANR